VSPALGHLIVFWTVLRNQSNALSIFCRDADVQVVSEGERVLKSITPRDYVVMAQTFQLLLELAACSIHKSGLHLILIFHCKLVVAFLCLTKLPVLS
jgi:hypothetical protein